MYATPTGPDNVYLELQPETRIKVDEVYENVVEDESETDVGVQRVNTGNTNQDGSIRRQAPPKTLDVSRKDVWKIQRMQLLIVVAVVITFLMAVVSLVFVITIKWPGNTSAVSKQGAEEGTLQELDVRDVEDCATNTQLCNRNAVCKTMEGSNICICNRGYAGNGKICTDIDECETSIYSCGANAICNNNMGSYNCTCSPGYFENGQACLDVNECATYAHNCDANAFCNNTEGSYNCTCSPGYIGNGTSCTGCHPVGVADPNRIPNAQMTASSYYSTTCYPYYGRLSETRGAGGWCPSTQQGPRTDYLQVDLGTVHSVCAVATQGESNIDERTTSYILRMSKNGVTWNTYKESNAEKVFQGNTDRDTIVQHALFSAMKARFVRFYYVSYYRWPAIRVEIYIYA